MTVGADAEHIAVAGMPQGHLDIADAVNAVGCDPAKRNIDGERVADHFHGERRLCREGYSVRNMGRRHPDWIVRPGLGQIQSPVDEGIAMARHISAEHADLAVRDLTRRPRVLTSDATAGLALLEKPGLIQNKNRILIGQGLQRIFTRRCRAARQRPTILDPEWPAGARDRDRPPLPHASSRSWRRSPPSSPSRNKPAEAATRSWVNNGAIRALTARSDDAQSSSVVSIEIPVIHDLRIMVTDGFRRSNKAQL
jgi:hypothetical protein